ncbi:MAG: hypothetical protein KTR32_35430 [Granulosicoccus sp.]|nr:hypothetical protein [Granulosicoccus sp.]
MNCIPLKSVLKALFALSVLCTLLAFSTSATAQSVEQSEVSIVKSEGVKISDIDDWLIGVFTSSDTINFSQYQWDPQCVYSSTGAYSIQVSSSNGGANLNLQSGGNSMNYRIYAVFRRGGNYFWTSSTNTTINIGNMSGSSASLTCADEQIAGINLWFAALVTPADFNPAPPGIYQDVVSLTVTPE